MNKAKNLRKKPWKNVDFKKWVKSIQTIILVRVRHECLTDSIWYTVLHIFRQVFWGWYQSNHQNFKKSLLSYSFYLVLWSNLTSVLYIVKKNQKFRASQVKLIKKRAAWGRVSRGLTVLYCQILAVSLQNRNLWMIIFYSALYFLKRCSIFDPSPLTQFWKFNNFLWVWWFLRKNISNFVPPVWKLHNPYCHSAKG